MGLKQKENRVKREKGGKPKKLTVNDRELRVSGGEVGGGMGDRGDGEEGMHLP